MSSPSYCEWESCIEENQREIELDMLSDVVTDLLSELISKVETQERLMAATRCDSMGYSADKSPPHTMNLLEVLQTKYVV